MTKKIRLMGVYGALFIAFLAVVLLLNPSRNMDVSTYRLAVIMISTFEYSFILSIGHVLAAVLMLLAVDRFGSGIRKNILLHRVFWSGLSASIMGLAAAILELVIWLSSRRMLEIPEGAPVPVEVWVTGSLFAAGGMLAAFIVVWLSPKREA